MKKIINKLKELVPAITEEQLKALEAEINSVCEKSRNEAKAELEKLQLENALEDAISKSGVRSEKAIRALLDLESITLNNGKLQGFSEQIDKLKKEQGYLFRENGSKPEFTASSAGGGKMTAKDFEKLSYKKRLKLFMENPELYKQLSK